MKTNVWNQLEVLKMGQLSNSSGSWGIKAVRYKEYPCIYFLIMNIFIQTPERSEGVVLNLTGDL